MFRKFFADIFSRSSDTASEVQQFKYCPQCNAEYRFDIVECSGCGVALIERDVDGGADNSHKKTAFQKIHPSDNLVNIQSAALLQIKLSKRLLEKANIPSIIYVEKTGVGKG